MRNLYKKLAPKTRTRKLHEIEHALFNARNSREKYLAASRYDTRTSFSRELTRTSFSYEYVCHGLKMFKNPSRDPVSLKYLVIKQWL